MPRGPAYTPEEDAKFYEALADKNLSHAERVDLVRRGVDRPRDAISQRLRKLSATLASPEKKSKASKPAGLAAPKSPAKRGRPAKTARANGDAARPQNSDTSFSGDVEVSLCGVVLRGSPSKVGAVLSQLGH